MGHFVRILFMTASACQLVPYAFVFFPCSERSSTKSPCRQVNAFFVPLKTLIFQQKITERGAVAAACVVAFPPCAGVNF